MTQINIEKEKESAINAKNIVMEYLQAAERRDFQTVRGYLRDSLSYVRPLHSFDGIEPYLKYFEHLKLPKFDYKKVFEDGNDVCLLYELKVGTPPVTSSVCLWAHVGDEGKISSIRVIFDPRPYIQQR